MSEWVSVKKKLPEKEPDSIGGSVYVLAYAPGSSDFFDYMAKAWFAWDTGHWYDALSDDPIGGVTHWMPLPEPPTDEAQAGGETERGNT